MTLAHAQLFKCSWEWLAKDPVQKSQTVVSVYSIVWVIPNSCPICMEVNEDLAISWFSKTDLYSDYPENRLRFFDGVFCKLLPGALKMLGVTQGHWPWPRITRKNGWIKGTFLFEKSVGLFLTWHKCYFESSTMFHIFSYIVSLRDRLSAVHLGEKWKLI